MSPDSESPKKPTSIDERIGALDEYTKFTMKVHADMIMSIDTKLDQLSTTVKDLSEATRRNTENIHALTDRAAKSDIRFERLAEIMTGLLTNHDARITALEQKQ